MGELNAYKILISIPEGKRQLRRPRCSWKVNIRMAIREIGWGSVGCIPLAQDRDHWWATVNMVMSPWVP
jgi:hypothetical protein